MVYNSYMPKQFVIVKNELYQLVVKVYDPYFKCYLLKVIPYDSSSPIISKIAKAEEIIHIAPHQLEAAKLLYT